MKLSPILILLPLAVDSVAGATATGSTTAFTRRSSSATPVERTPGRLRNLDASAERRHDNPPGGLSSNQQPPPPQTQQPPESNGKPERPRDVFDRDPDQSAIARHDDDPLGPGSGEKQLDTATRHNNAPPGRDVSGQYSFTPSSSSRLFGSPSVAPSVSAAPSGMPSASPAPSIYPSSTPSSLPSLSNVPSMAPSRDATRVQPDTVPSMTPSVVPSSAPSFDCSSDDGFFAGGGLNSIVVKYRYEVEYTPDPDLDVDEMLKAVEKQSSDVVLADLFPDLCGVTTDSPTVSLSPSLSPSVSMVPSSLPTREGNSTDESGRLLVEGRRRRLEAIGLSPQTPDVFDKTATCVASTSVITNCNVTLGFMTVFLAPGTSEDGESDIVRAALKASMDAGEFNNTTHPAIRRISYLDETNTTDPTIPDAPTPSPGKSAGKSDGGIPIWAYVLIALGVLLFIGLGIFVWRRRRSREIVKDTDTRDDDYPEDMEEIDENQSYEPPDGMSRLTTQHEEEYDDYEEDTRQ